MQQLTSVTTAKNLTGHRSSRLSIKYGPEGPQNHDSGPMQVERLRLTGFKSFVEPTELAIEPGLTGIVGPNGCGKSNLVEALRWVMGEGSAKRLRGGEMEQGSFAGPASGRAR